MGIGEAGEGAFQEAQRYRKVLPTYVCEKRVIKTYDYNDDSF